MSYIVHLTKNNWRGPTRVDDFSGDIDGEGKGEGRTAIDRMVQRVAKVMMTVGDNEQFRVLTAGSI